MKRKDIRGEAGQEKVKIYEEINDLYLKGERIALTEHKSGFPAVTVDAGDIHIITDCLSLEQFWAMKKTERR